MIAIPLILILFFFVTTSQVIAFSLQDNIEVSKLENKLTQVQIVAIQEGQYSVIVNNTLGYEIVQQNECHGQIKAKEIKTCFITIDDSIQPLSIPLSQPIGGERQSATAQPPPSSQLSQEPTVH